MVNSSSACSHFNW